MMRFISVGFLLLLSFSPSPCAYGAKSLSTGEIATVYSSLTTKREGPFVFDKTSTSWNELDMDLVVRLLNRTQTGAGQFEFQELMQPLTKVESIKKRQDIIKKLIALDKDVFEDLQAQIADYASIVEPLFVQLFLEEKAPETLTELNVLSFSPFSMLPSNMGLRFQFYSSLTGLLGLVSSVLFDYDSLRRNGRLIWRGTDEGVPVSLRRRTWLAYNLLGQTTVLAYGTYLTAMNVYNINKMIYEVDNYVFEFAKALKKIDQFHVFLAEKTALKKSSIGKSILQLLTTDAFVKSKLSKALQARIDRESSSLYAVPTPILWWDMINQLGHLEEIKKQRQSLLPIIRGVGVLDSYFSVAKFFREKQELSKESHSNEYSHAFPITLAKFLEGDEPVFHFKNIHNPLASERSSAGNDFNLGGLHKHVVLTGPHACGKTFAMKTIAFGHALSQAIGIAFANEAELNPIHELLTYLNIGDNAAEGQSSFQAEDDRMAWIRERIAASNRGSILVIIDEMYAKANPRLAPVMATDFMRAIYQEKAVSVLLATHFGEPSVLEEETKGLIWNWQPEVLQDGDSFRPTFRIIEGAADWWFSDIDKMRAYMKWMQGRTYMKSKSKL